jgi:hypothetical protein
VLATGAALVLYGVAVWFGNLNQDEGWYLYAARRVASGAAVYRDFFFTQGPLMPHVYALLSGLWSPYGVLGGRLVTVFFGLLGCVLAALLARRSVPSPRAAEAGLMAFALTACNLYHVYFTTIPKTYALASCLVLGGYLMLSVCLSRRKKTRSLMSSMWALPAGLLIALAAGTRLSLGALLPVTVLWLLATCRKTGAAFFWFALGGGIGLAVVYGPVLLDSREQFLFAQSFHTARGGHDVFFLAGSLARTMRAYLPACLLALALAAFRLFRRTGGEPRTDMEEAAGCEYRGMAWPGLWLCAFLAVFLVQLTSPYPYDDYQVPVMGLFVAALAGSAVNSVSSGGMARAHLPLLGDGLPAVGVRLAACARVACSAPGPLLGRPQAHARPCAAAHDRARCPRLGRRRRGLADAGRVSGGRGGDACAGRPRDGAVLLFSSPQRRDCGPLSCDE